ncbi:MAG TPA: hypothetical protein VK860_12020, partial [Ilumatobacteraceae bacterium]|nr:hypothetical protein [Ilumatobacteraceae bacterium]
MQPVGRARGRDAPIAVVEQRDPQVILERGEVVCNVFAGSSTYNMMMDEPAVMDEAQSGDSFDAFFLERFAELSRLAFLLTG